MADQTPAGTAGATPSAAWTATVDRLPPEGVEVEVRNGDIIQTLVYANNLWWFPDRSMYVYFRPAAWRHLDA